MCWASLTGSRPPGVTEVDDVRADEGGGDGDLFAVHVLGGEVIADDPDARGPAAAAGRDPAGPDVA